MKKFGLFVSAVALIAAVSVEAQTTPATPEQKSAVPGFIFNTSNLLLDLESYQGGVGIKLIYPEYALRASAGGSYTGTTGQLDFNLGLTYEKPLFTGRVSPYWAINSIFAYSQERSEIDPDNWMKLKGFSAGVGGVLGVELFILDFLSIFAEYELSASVAWSFTSRSLDGTVSESSSTNFNAATGLGNSGSLGLVVYLKPTGRLPVKEPIQQKKK
jgi:hypothetical protein